MSTRLPKRRASAGRAIPPAPPAGGGPGGGLGGAPPPSGAPPPPPPRRPGPGLVCRGARLGHPLARFVPATVVGAFLLGALTKWLVSRPRPRGTDYGFPSGHALGAAVFFGAVVYVLWTLGVPRVPRWLGTLLACLLVLGVAWSRLYLRAHWLSDVVGGLVGGLAYLLVTLVVIERRLRSPPT